MNTKLRDWITNNPELAAMLTKADNDFVAAREAARDLPLADKLAAFRKASDDYDAAYDAVMEKIAEAKEAERNFPFSGSF